MTLNSIENIRQSFQIDMRTFDLYQKDVQQNIEKIKQEVLDFQQFMQDGGSIEVKPGTAVNEHGKEVYTMGIDDNPYSREVVSYALERRIEQTRDYITISIIMALSHLISIFDAKCLDAYLCYVQSIPAPEGSTKTAEERVNEFGFKSFSSQIASWKGNVKVDFEKILGKAIIQELIEIAYSGEADPRSGMLTHP